ncbi:MAG: hypothetical protein K2H21_09390, partial [Muribaculaceae bacterium]|nr:hypothetical protein [Muribaculaceae bacterium]
ALGISDVMLTAEPDVKWGSGLILLVECVCADTSRVEEICRSLLAPHEVPKEIRSVRRLPRTPNGKLRR